MAKIFRSLLVLAFSITLGACSSVPRTYQLEAGARYESYSEKPAESLATSLSRELGSPVMILFGDPTHIKSTAGGFQVGVTEKAKNLLTRITVYNQTFESVNYTFLYKGIPISETLNPTAWGFDVSIGYQLWWFRPQMSYKYEFLKMNTVVNSPTGALTMDMSQKNFFIGGGLAFDVPLSDSVALVTQADYRVPVNANGAEISSTTFQAGIRMFKWNPK